MRQVRHLLIGGRVQGVGYRAFVQREAARRGIDGWVRNRRDGTVEAVVAGEPDRIAALIDICRCGPSDAIVGIIEELEGDAASVNPASGFAIRATV